jgi:hypothetical protein
MSTFKIIVYLHSEKERVSHFQTNACMTWETFGGAQILKKKKNPRSYSWIHFVWIFQVHHQELISWLWISKLARWKSLTSVTSQQSVILKYQLYEASWIYLTFLLCFGQFWLEVYRYWLHAAYVLVETLQKSVTSPVANEKWPPSGYLPASTSESYCQWTTVFPAT